MLSGATMTPSGEIFRTTCSSTSTFYRLQPTTQSRHHACSQSVKKELVDVLEPVPSNYQTDILKYWPSVDRCVELTISSYVSFLSVFFKGRGIEDGVLFTACKT